MFSSSWSIGRLAVLLFGLLNFVSYVSSVEIDYCSTFNSADTNRNASIWQSQGLCSKFCIEKYAYAVVQYDSCWCSNYAPNTNTTGCERKCPGYPDELCGGIGLFGYIELVLQPSGTKTATSSSTTASSASPTVTKSLEPVTTTVVIPPIVITKPSATFSSSSTQSAETTEPPSSSSTWVPTPIVSLETVTGQPGLVRTVTYTPTAPPSAESASQTSKRVASGLGVGGAVGLALGLVALVAIIGAFAFFCLRRRRKQEQKEAELADSSRESVGTVGGPIPSRTMSENSRYVLGTDGRQVVETWENQNAPGSRKSRLMPVDPRLDPFSPVYQRGENKSRESVNTIRDDHDYSRRVQGQGTILRATNPDT